MVALPEVGAGRLGGCQKDRGPSPEAEFRDGFSEQTEGL